MPEMSRRADKDLASVPKSVAERAKAIIDRLDREPALGKKLLGKLEGKRSARLGRSYRIIYRVTDAGVVQVLTITPRKDSYR